MTRAQYEAFLKELILNARKEPDEQKAVDDFLKRYESHHEALATDELCDAP